MRTKLPTRKKLDSTIILLVPSDLKLSLFELAAARGMTAAALARQGIASIVGKAA